MEDARVQRIYEISDKLVREIDCAFHRYLVRDLDWNVRILALSGPRGVGKTTMFLQFLKEHPSEAQQALYVSLDNLWLNATELYDLVDYHVKHGGTRLLLDEIHYLPDWQRLVKNLYDNFKTLRIAYTGSSILRLSAGQGDLSRRQVAYHLQGLSFREFLNLEHGFDFPAVGLAELLRDHVDLADRVTRKTKVIPAFEKYMKMGYYPFYREEPGHFTQKLLQVVNQVLDADLPKTEDVTPETVRKVRRMLAILAASTPQTPNVSALCRNLEMDRKQGLRVLHALRRAGLLGLLSEDADSLKHLGSPNKIYCDNANLMYALVGSPDKGTVRESFFNNQLGVAHELSYPKHGDFRVDGRFLFEVGGPGKGFEQIADQPESYFAVDDLEVGRGSRLPLWLFGFLY